MISLTLILSLSKRIKTTSKLKKESLKCLSTTQKSLTRKSSMQESKVLTRNLRKLTDTKCRVVDRRKPKALITVKCAFLEIYNEELIDLLDHDKLIPAKKEINIREEKNGTISVFGLKEVSVESAEEMTNCLNVGSRARSTATTSMN